MGCDIASVAGGRVSTFLFTRPARVIKHFAEHARPAIGLGRRGANQSVQPQVAKIYARMIVQKFVGSLCGHSIDWSALATERRRSRSRRQKTMIQIRGRPATCVHRLVRPVADARSWTRSGRRHISGNALTHMPTLIGWLWSSAPVPPYVSPVPRFS